VGKLPDAYESETVPEVGDVRKPSSRFLKQNLKYWTSQPLQTRVFRLVLGEPQCKEHFDVVERVQGMALLLFISLMDGRFIISLFPDIDQYLTCMTHELREEKYTRELDIILLVYQEDSVLFKSEKCRNTQFDYHYCSNFGMFPVPQ